MNVSKQKREDLIGKIKEIRRFIARATQDENTGNLLTYLSELEKEVKGKKYGLVFEEHREAVDELLDTHVPVLAEEKDFIIDNGGQMNFLIEGDNLAALHLLEKTHKGNIDLIYIDPPYNTGQNFIYDDKYIDKEDAFRHSKWISFMTRRLEQAYKLLTNKGVIFIQISDIENGHLRLICDSIFGEDNFINEITVMAKVGAGASGGGEDKRLKKNIEYILVYCKNYSEIDKFETIWKRTELMQYIQNMKNEGKSFKYTSVLTRCQDITPYKTIKDGSGEDIEIYKVNDYEVKNVTSIQKELNLPMQEIYTKNIDKIMTTTNAQSSIRQRVWDATGNGNEMYMARYTPKSGKSKGIPTEIFYMGKQKVQVIWLKDTTEVISKGIFKKEKIGTYWDGFSWINVTKEGKTEFSDGKKPIALMQRIMSLFSNTDITVLDFFAGSASTGHAVIAQNREDRGKRKFILCTNNENNIARTKAYCRLKNVIQEFNNEDSLKYYKIGFVPITERLYYEYADELLLHIRELVELENGVNFFGNAEIAIILTDEELTDFVDNVVDFKKCRKLYIGHNVLPTGEQESALKKARVEVNVIPNYYYNELEV